MVDVMEVVETGCGIRDRNGMKGGREGNVMEKKGGRKECAEERVE